MAQSDKSSNKVDQAKPKDDAKAKADAAKKHSQVDESGADVSKKKK
jgi:hypothetical protein